ncbi:restriction system modified-DNA reader domain-containing protein [Georgenia yuyongxinii]
MPPRPAPGPRLIIVAGAVADDVRPALDPLVGSGVSVYEMAVRQLTSGRRFLEVTELRPRQLVPGPTVLTGSARATRIELAVSPAPTADGAAPPTEPVPVVPVPEVSAAPTEVEERARAKAGDPVSVQPVQPVQPAQPVQLAAHDAPSPAEQVPPAAAAVAPAVDAPAVDTPAAPAPAPAVPVVTAASHGVPGAPAAPYRGDAGDGVVSDDAADLALIAQTLGGDTPLTWVQLRRGIRYEATLTSDGLVRLAGGAAFDDPDLAAAAASGRDDVDGWRVWRFGDGGPSLAEALTELQSAAARADGGRRRRHGG